MHHITDIKSVSKDIAAGLKVLKERIAAAQVPSSKLDESFNLATWNIREFGKKPRTQADTEHGRQILAEIEGLKQLIQAYEDNLIQSA